jgi:septal ring factor EnvC (AmiA/AmiB activator)
MSTRHTETRQQLATIRQQLDENRQQLSQLNDALARLDDRFRQDFEARYPTAEAREAAIKEVHEWLRRAKERRAKERQGKGGK